MSMKIPPVSALGRFIVQKKVSKVNQTLPPEISSSKSDTFSFCASTAYYIKKYNTLPNEIRKILKPQDAVDMFKNMEYIQKGLAEGKTIGQGNHSRVFENPWLKDYCVLITNEGFPTQQIVYSRYELGDAIWADRDNELIQIVKKIS